jgi:hypothetical protein
MHFLQSARVGYKSEAMLNKANASFDKELIGKLQASQASLDPVANFWAGEERTITFQI